MCTNRKWMRTDNWLLCPNRGWMGTDNWLLCPNRGWMRTDNWLMCPNRGWTRTDNWLMCPNRGWTRADHWLMCPNRGLTRTDHWLMCPNRGWMRADHWLMCPNRGWTRADNWQNWPVLYLVVSPCPWLHPPLNKQNVRKKNLITYFELLVVSYCQFPSCRFAIVLSDVPWHRTWWHYDMSRHEYEEWPNNRCWLTPTSASRRIR